MENEKEEGSIIGAVETAATNIIEGAVAGGVAGAEAAAVKEFAVVAGEVAAIVAEKAETIIGAISGGSDGCVATSGNRLQDVCHGAADAAGWWVDLATGTDFKNEVRQGTRFGKALVAEKLALIHSEVSEALEGHRKGLMDDKLPKRQMVEVELADAVIRICDLAGAMGLDLGGAISEKLAFNAVRPDHKPEARQAEGGKSY